MVRLGIILTILVTLPTLWCLKYISRGFLQGHKFYKANGRTMTEEEIRSWTKNNRIKESNQN